MSTITTRSGKGSPLTSDEVDSNFTNLNTDKLELSGGTMTGSVTFDGTVLDYNATASGLFDSISSTNLDLYTDNRGHNTNLNPSTGYVAQLANKVYNLTVNSTGISFRLYGNIIQQNANDQWSSTTNIHYSDVTLNWSGTTVATVSNAGTITASSNLPATTYTLGTTALDDAISSAAATAGVSSNLYDWIPSEVTVTETSDVFRARLAGSSTDLDTYSFTQNSASVYLYSHFVVAGRFLILGQYPNQNDSGFNDSSASANPDTEITVARFTRSVQTAASSFGLTSTSNGNINLDPNGSGKVIFKGNSTKGSGQFVLNCENNSHGITVKGPPHSAGASYTLTLPDDDGNSNEVLTTDGSGNLSWTTPAGSYADSDVDTHLNQSSANTGQVLTWNGSDYNWTTVSGGSGGIALTDLSVTQNTASGSGSLTYNNTSGVFSYTPPASSGSGSSGSALSDPIKQTEFTNTATNTFSVSYTPNNINVFLNGSKLAASDFTATNGTSVVLNSACAASDVVTVVEYGASFASEYSASTFTVGTSSEYNTTSKVLTTAYTVGKVAVYLNGVKLIIGANNDFTATDGSSINLTSAAPVTGDTIEVVEYGSVVSPDVLRHQEITASNNQTVFPVTSIVNASNVVVYFNGSRLLTTEYSVNSTNNTVTLQTAAAAGDIVIVDELGTTSVASNVQTLTDLSDTPGSLGTAGQVLQVGSNGSLEFADSGGGMTVYTDLSGTDGTPSGATYLLNASSPANGDLAFVTSNNNVYIRAASGWRKIATIQEAPSAVTGHSSSYSTIGQNATTDITLSTTDPEGFDVTWSYVVGGNGTLSGSNINNSNGDTLASIAVQTANANSGGTNTITYRITRQTTTIAGDFEITFTATDSQSSGTSDTGTISFSLVFAADWSGGGTLEATYTGMSNNDRPVLDGTGERLAVGGHTSDTIKIYKRSGTSWALEQTFATGTSGTGTDPLQRLLKINNTGDLIAWDHSLYGSAGIYAARRSGTTWTRETVGAALNSDSVFAMSGDGLNVFTMSKASTTALRRYTYSSGSWSSTDFTMSSAGTNSLGCNYDGTEVFVGDFANSRIFRYTISGSSITLSETITGDATKQLGFSSYGTNISKNGLTLIAWQRHHGSTNTGRRGALNVYQRASTSSNFGSYVTQFNSSTSGNNYLGEVASVSDDGTQIVYGADLDAQVYVAEYDGTSSWTSHSINEPSGEGGSRLTGMSGDTNRVAYISSTSSFGKMFIYKGG